jgi:hypothetical protein
MIKFLLGFVLGVVVATVGFAGLAQILDLGVAKIQDQSKELAK